MKPLTKKQISDIRKAAPGAMNCTSIGEVILKTNKDRNTTDLLIEMKSYNYGNFCDSKGMQSLLETLQNMGIVSKQTKTMWLGFYESKLYMWCQAESLLPT